MLFLSGLQDEMVPPFHMKMLYAKAAARNPQCTFVEFPSGMHMDTWLSGGDVYWKTNMQFLEKHAPEKRKDDTGKIISLSLGIMFVLSMLLEILF